MPWNPMDAPSPEGRTYLITGANSGLGLRTAHVLAARGAHVILACRNPAKAEDARQRLVDAVPGAQLEIVPLDLADLGSVHACADDLLRREVPLHGLVNNAGVMAIPRRETADGFEMQIGTNHLGHFVLTARLWSHVDAHQGRIVHVSSMAHQMGRVNPADPMGSQRYDRWRQYGFSKLANLLFHYELSRRLARADAAATSMAAHPGYADTNLQHVAPQMDGSALAQAGSRLANRWLAQSVERGAEPQLRALLDADARNGDFYGPHGPFGVWGHAVPVRPGAHALRESDQRWLWDWSEQTTGVRFDGLPTAA